MLATNIMLKFQSGANDARSDDTSCLKMSIADWLNSHPNPNGALTYDTRLSTNQRRDEASLMTLQAGSFVLSILMGTTLGTLLAITTQ